MNKKIMIVLIDETSMRVNKKREEWKNTLKKGFRISRSQKKFMHRNFNPERRIVEVILDGIIDADN